jgi:chemotaxis protein MotA
MSFWSKLTHSLFSSDLPIFFVMIFTVLTFLLVYRTKKIVERDIGKWERERNKRFTQYMYKILTISYTLFITEISLFPLFGMLGTVTALLGLDMSDAEAISNAKNNFFDALTSTTWGIIFAVIFKVVNAFIATSVEDSIRKLSELSDKFKTRIVSVFEEESEK